MTRLQVLEWSAWDRFLIRHVAPDAIRLPVVPGNPLASRGDINAPMLLHVNLSRPRSVFPDIECWLRRFEAAGRPVLNGYCDSIDKCAVQAGCRAAGLPSVSATRDGDPDGLLIIKSRANHRGLFERNLPAELAGMLAPPEWVYPERVHRLRRADVPDTIWRDPRIVIERWVDNAAGRFQRAYVVGTFVAIATSWSPGLVKEMDHRVPVTVEFVDAAALRLLDACDPVSVAYRLARAMRVDVGAIDLALDDAGIVHAIDVNLTPYWGDHVLNAALIARISMALATLARTGSNFALGLSMPSAA